jgi:hypothetical protein
LKSDPVLADWLDTIARRFRHVCFEGKALGFKAELSLTVDAGPAGIDNAKNLKFIGHVRAFAPFKKHPLIEYQIASLWKHEQKNWKLVSWSDHDLTRFTTRDYILMENPRAVKWSSKKADVPHESNEFLVSDHFEKMNLSHDTAALDPLTSVIFGLARPSVRNEESEKPQSIYVLHKTGIKKIAILESVGSVVVKFDKSEILFSDWEQQTFTQLLFKDPRLPISLVLRRTVLE